jgi:hypothetical protein
LFALFCANRIEMEKGSDEILISDLWKEHRAAPFPKGFRAKDVDGTSGGIDSEIGRFQE